MNAKECLQVMLFKHVMKHYLLSLCMLSRANNQVFIIWKSKGLYTLGTKFIGILTAKYCYSVYRTLLEKRVLWLSHRWNP